MWLVESAYSSATQRMRQGNQSLHIGTSLDDMVGPRLKTNKTRNKHKREWGGLGRIVLKWMPTETIKSLPSQACPEVTEIL